MQVASSYGLWRRWLAVGSVYGMIAGVFIVAVALLPKAYGLEDVSRVTFWLHEGGPGPVTDGVRLATAVTGALTVGVSVIAWCLRPAAVEDRAGDRRAGRALATGLVVWFVLDSSASIATGGALNVIGNVTFLVALLPPSVAMARKG